jgi:hypothetical protein
MLYLRAVEHFQESAVIRVFAAQYYNIYRSNHRIEQIYLTEAGVCARSPPVGRCLWRRAALVCRFTTLRVSCSRWAPSPLSAQTLSPTFDIVFIAFQRLHQLRQVGQRAGVRVGRGWVRLEWQVWG